VISYEQPKLLSGEEEVEDLTPKAKKMKKSRSCPTSPFPTSSAAKSDFASQPASPNSNFPSFLVDMDEDEVTYTGRKSKKMRDREESFGESFETIENKKTLKKKSKKMQTLNRTCRFLVRVRNLTTGRGLYQKSNVQHSRVRGRGRRPYVVVQNLQHLPLLVVQLREELVQIDAEAMDVL